MSMRARRDWNLGAGTAASPDQGGWPAYPPPSESAGSYPGVQASDRAGVPPHQPERGAPLRRSPRGRRNWHALLPALTFVVGVTLGGALVGLPEWGQSDTGAPPSATPSPVTSSPAPTALSPTEACLAAGGDAAKAVDLLGQAAAAIRDLDASRLQQVLDEAQRLDAMIRAEVGRCRAG